MMRRLESDVVGSLFWIVIGIFFVVCGLKLKLGSFRNPGPGFLPLIMAMVLIFFSMPDFVKGLSRPERPIKGISWRPQALVVGSVFFYGFLLEFFGFPLSTFILMFLLFGFLRGKRKWSNVFLYSVATALTAWLVFSVALNVPFPLSRLRAIWM